MSCQAIVLVADTDYAAGKVLVYDRLFDLPLVWSIIRASMRSY